MRVLHVIPFVALRHGGSTHALRKITAACTSFASRVTVLTGESLSDPNILSGFHPEVEVVSRPGPVQRLERISLGTIRYLVETRNEFDVIHVHTQFNFTVTAASWVARLTGLPVIIRPTGTLDPWCLAYKAWKKRPYFRLFIKPALHWAAAVHVTSQHEWSSIAALGFAEKTETVPLCAGQINDSMSRKPVHAPREILFMSRWDTVKNIPKLIEAFELLLSETDNLRLVLAGAGESKLTAEIHRQIEETGLGEFIETPGFLQGDAKEAAFRSATVFVLPSFQENFGIAAVEAMARGVPLVMSDGLALSHECRQEDAAVLVSPESSRSIADGILEAMRPQRAKQVVMAAHSLVERSFTAAAMTTNLRSMYQKVLN